MLCLRFNLFVYVFVYSHDCMSVHVGAGHSLYSARLVITQTTAGLVLCHQRGTEATTDPTL